MLPVTIASFGLLIAGSPTVRFMRETDARRVIGKLQ
jgi:hypothetical protein